MKLKAFFEKIIDAILFPIVTIQVMIDESRRYNDDGDWSTGKK